MPIREFGEVQVETTDDGFLIDADQWTPDIARAIANDVGIGQLTDQHWTVISFCREDAAKEGQPPGLRRISKMSGVNMKELYGLFPKGPGKLAAMVAGPPKPKGCI